LLNLKVILFVLYEDDEDKDMLLIIGISVGGVLVVAIGVLVMAWCVHHKKCKRKSNRGGYSFVVKQ